MGDKQYQINVKLVRDDKIEVTIWRTKSRVRHFTILVTKDGLTITSDKLVINPRASNSISVDSL